ncbi:MAG: hypothetical protein POELPBGB_00935 [Bacteroidia bacterium]|nr:hypothetical protein [Bacteroidia bacterium]
MKLKKIFLYLLLFILAVFGVFMVNLIWFKPFSINHFYERIFIEYAMEDPEILSQLRILEGMGINFHNDDLTDISDARFQRLKKKLNDNYNTLQDYDREKLSKKQQLSYDILKWFLDDAVRREQFMYHDYIITQLQGVHMDLPDFMVNVHQINTKKDAENYIARLSKFDTKFEQLLEQLRLREEREIIPPRFAVEKALKQTQEFIKDSALQNILYTSFKEKTDTLKGLSAEDKTALQQNVLNEVSKTVYPAYRSLEKYLAQLAEKSTGVDGVWKLPEGDKWYAFQLRSNTTTDMTPEEVYQLGVSEVGRIEKEMRTILDSIGVPDTGSVGSILSHFAKDPQFLYPDNAAGKEQCLKDYQTIIDEIDNNLSELFDMRPKMGVKVEAVPEFKQQGAPGAYYNPPAMDGTRPGIFYANLRSMAEIPKFGMRTLSYHEAIPGHHFQLAIQQELTGVPTFRKVLPFTAYAEGWALYAERLAWEYGFQKDPYSDLGRLQAEIFRAVRLVVDVGIHHKRWTREQAIDYMIEKTGMPEGDVVAEIERYIVWPGQACAYKVGQLKILQLRDYARKELGDKFNIKEFHNVVLMNGSMPLSILEELVKQYVKEKK